MLSRLVHWLWDRHGTDRCSRCLDQLRVAQRLAWVECRPEPTLPNPNINIKTGKPVDGTYPPPPPSPDIVISTTIYEGGGVRMATWPGEDPT